MDCRTALEILDVARPESGDLAEPELAEAAAHLEMHTDCRDEFRRRQALDLQIGAAMRGVPVPRDLQARLLAELEMAADTPEAEVEDQPADAVHKAETTKSRRNWLRLAVGIAACLVAGIAAWQFSPGGPEPLDADVVLNRAAEAIDGEGFAFDELADFDGDYRAELPADWREVQRLKIPGPKALRPANRPESAVAMYRFAFRHRRRNVTGYLLVLPRGMVQNPPAYESLGEANPVYPRGMAARSWTEGEFVYICIVPRGENIDALRTLLSPRTA